MTSTPAPTPTSTTGPVTPTFQVTGMTCDHSARAVTDELQQVAHVIAVTVEVSTGQVVMTSDQPIDSVAVAAAVNEAGYRLS
jgi:copper chaperone CopZ